MNSFENSQGHVDPNVIQIKYKANGTKQGNAPEVHQKCS